MHEIIDGQLHPIRKLVTLSCFLNLTQDFSLQHTHKHTQMHVCTRMCRLHLVDYKFVCKLCICALLISFKRSFLMAPSACQISKPNRVGQPLAQHTTHTAHIATVAILSHIPSHGWPNITAAICGGRAPLMPLRSDDAGAAGNRLPLHHPKLT